MKQQGAIMKTGKNYQNQLVAKNPLHLAHVEESSKKSEEYLEDFAQWCIDLIEFKGLGNRTNTGQGIQVHISNTRGNGQGNNAIGYCYHTSTSEGDKRAIEISRDISDTYQALMVTAHEVAHAMTTEDTGHEGEFISIVGGQKNRRENSLFKMNGIPTATEVSPYFKELVRGWIVANGTYNHVAYASHPKSKSRTCSVYCLDVNCAGATKSTKGRGFGMVFRVSTTLAMKLTLSCPSCGGRTYADIK